MFAKCSNPDCGLPFDHREGRLIRFRSPDAKSPSEHDCIEHFWLCGKCSELYVFEYESGAGIMITRRVTEFQKTAALSLAATA
jgi:hypothetical protein